MNPEEIKAIIETDMFTDKFNVLHHDGVTVEQVKQAVDDLTAFQYANWLDEKGKL